MLFVDLFHRGAIVHSVHGVVASMNYSLSHRPSCQIASNIYFLFISNDYVAMATSVWVTFCGHI